MDGFKIVQQFFANMHCSKCQAKFKPEGISLLREENNFFVVKIICTECDQPVGIAIVGIKSRSETEKLLADKKAKAQEIPAGPPPINYDDVIEAHKFFSNLGPDWTKHIKNKIEISLPGDDEVIEVETTVEHEEEIIELDEEDYDIFDYDDLDDFDEDDMDFIDEVDDEKTDEE
jgi:hypothetical protein